MSNRRTEAAPTPATQINKPRPSVADWSPLIAVLLIAVLAWLAYLPAMSGGFILDDDLLLTQNKIIKAPDGLYRFWFTTEPADYWPVTNSSLWLEWRLWDNYPNGYHATNLFLHIANCWLIWLILRRLSIPGALLAALLFAVHPVNVESVAWIAQRKNLLAMLFFLLSIFWFLRVEGNAAAPANRLYRSGHGRWYWLSVASFLLAMLSKGSVAVLPVLLLLIVWWQSGRIAKWDYLRAVPFFVIAVVLTVVNIWFQSHDVERPIREAHFLERLLGAGATVWFYLYKALLPTKLAFVYPQWNIHASEPQQWLPLVGTIVVTALLWWQRRSNWGRTLWFAWLFFCVALVPVMGFTDVGFMQYSLVADHYQHIPLIAVVTLVAAIGVCWYQHSSSNLVRRAAVIGAVLLVGVLSYLTFQQSALYAGPITLYQDSIAKNPTCAMLYNNLGNALANDGQPERAIEYFEQVLQFKPDDPEIHNNFGRALQNAGRMPEAIAQFETAIHLKPDLARAYSNLGQALVKSGKVPEAIEPLRRAIELKPDYAEAHSNLGSALLRAGISTEAIHEYEQALVIDPSLPEVHSNLGNALLKAGQTLKAVDQYRKSLRLKPDDAETHSNLAFALLRAGWSQDALMEYAQAAELAPQSPEIHFNFANAFAKLGQMSAAVDQFEQAVKLRPDYVDAQVNLGTTLMAMQRYPEAVEHYEKAVQLRPGIAVFQFNLAAALAAIGRSQEAIGRFQEAIRLKPDYPEAYFSMAMIHERLGENAAAKSLAEKALQLARSQDKAALVQQIEAALKTYQTGRENSARSPDANAAPKAP